MDLDYQLAMKLQNEWNNTSEEPPKKKKKYISKEASGIVDPHWEIIDPNPDIFSLFQIFDKKYFWNQLVSVEVKWSPRMYSCAGICTYKGKLGGCVIALSLPLLKLRPRKDLVETLLHEMIHAYLFVADRNRDRGEHGPKFHEHMYRINREAGTKITVYHTFHDEVKHYKQHWWRCNGPCQNEKPFFGLVKRSMNRAPGPNDFWFAEHKGRCGGEFMKVKEPEGFKSRKKGEKSCEKNKNKTSGSPLAKYFPDVPKHSPPTGALNGNTSKPKSKSSNKKGSNTRKDSPSGLLDKFVSSVPKNKDSVKTINNDNSSAKIDNYKKISNVHGFTNLSKPGSCNNKDTTLKKGNGFGGAGLKSNMGGTLLLNPQSSTSAKSNNPNNEESSIPASEVVPFAGSGHVLGGGVADRSKSKLLNLYLNKTPTNQNKDSPASSLLSMSKNKDTSARSVPSTSKNKDSPARSLPSMSKNKDTSARSVSSTSKNKDSPASNLPSMSKNKDSPVRSVPSTSKNKEPKKEVDSICLVSDSDGDDEDPLVHCPVCNKGMSMSLVSYHLEEGCSSLESVFERSLTVKDEEGDPGLETGKALTDSVNCPICGISSTLHDINQHLDNCLG